MLKMALKVLILFPTICECESAFLALLAIKPNVQNRLDAIYYMRIALSKMESHIAELIAKKEVHPKFVPFQFKSFSKNFH